MLPPDIISVILQFLNVTEIKHLAQAFSSGWPYLWNHVKSLFQYSSYESRVRFKDVLWLIKNGINIIQVDIIIVADEDDDLEEMIVEIDRFILPYSLPVLKELNIFGLGKRKLVKVFSAHIAAAAPNLEIFSCSYKSTTDAAIIPIADYCSKLNYFYVEHSDITDASILALCYKCSLLRSVYFYDCPHLTDESLIALKNVGWRLETLYLESCTFSDHAIISLLSVCISLRRVYLLHMHIDNDVIDHLWNALPLIQCIYVNNRHLSNDIIVQLARTCCTNLVALYVHDFKRCSDVSINALVQHCIHLKDLQFFNFDRLESTTSRMVDRTFFSMHNVCWHKCENVEHSLCLMSCPYLTDACLLAFSSSNRDLQHLHLASCHKITDIGLQTIAQYCTSLRHVLIQGCSITRTGIRELVSKNCYLIELELNTVFILSADISDLAKHCLHLEAIYLDHCFEITNSAILALLVHCAPLRIMDVKHCRCIKHKPIIKILMNRKKLRHGETLNWRLDMYHGKCNGDGKRTSSS